MTIEFRTEHFSGAATSGVTPAGMRTLRAGTPFIGLFLLSNIPATFES